MKGQFVRFVAVGVLCTLVDAGLHYAVWFGLGLSRSVPPAASGVAFGLLKALTYATAMIVGFYANRNWTFKAEGSSRRQAGRFAVVSLSALCVNSFFAPLASHAAGGGKVGWAVGLFVGTGLATLVTYTGHRRWTFAPEKNVPAGEVGV